jgi:hypothetical protein
MTSIRRLDEMSSTRSHAPQAHCVGWRRLLSRPPPGRYPPVLTSLAQAVYACRALLAAFFCLGSRRSSCELRSPLGYAVHTVMAISNA